MKQTKIDRKELYKIDAEELESYKDAILRSSRSRTSSGWKAHDLHQLKKIHDKYYASDKARLTGCGQCIMKMIDRLAMMLKKYIK